MHTTKLYVGILLMAAFASCQKNDSAPPVIDEDVNLGGGTSISGTFINSFQQPAANLNTQQLDLHRAADVAFGDIFVTAPNEINPGLGPVFNQNSCENCHVANGKSPFPANSGELRGLLMRLSVPGSGIHGEPVPVPGFGGQLQTRAVFGKSPEGTLSWQTVEQIVQYLDGEEVSLRKINFSIDNPYETWPANVLLSPRIAPAVIGLGLLEAIDPSDILALADESDLNGDGISGKANMVWNVEQNQSQLGRFGWKAGQPTLKQQSAAAYNDDMGITNPYFPKESCTGQAQHDGQTDDPEIDESTLLAATFYAQSLGVPRRRNWDNPEVMMGKQLFSKIACADCHHPGFITGPHPEFDFLSFQIIYPYTDMLLHDMGADLADNRPDFLATGNEWRTPPLWGIGLVETVGGHSNFLHDGRARSLEEAILWHGGEAENSREEFKKLNKQDRLALIRFLESL
ncbi:MAG: c-type cytochrome [Lewinellaceae bacterium]|nr:c-type cytochrome [Saprospiraceae bacterium]MCB9343796.1 c-type cytochrome [Lewinellaceae bacterium]